MLSPVSRPVTPAVLSLEVLAQNTEATAEQPTQFRVLVRHFLECFFRNELLSTDGEAKTRLVQAAFALGLPGFVIALYLYTPYHMPHRVRPYWSQAGDHYFYVLYAFVAMGLVAIFEWDLFFPGLLDTYVLSPLPVRYGRMFRARVVAILIVIGAVLIDSNFLPPVVLPAATDPPHLFRFLAAHLLAVGAAGLFAAAFFLGMEGLLLALLGDRLFRRISLWVQGLSVFALLTLLFLYPVFCGALGALLESGSALPRWIPPLWFLGIYQRILDGPATPLIFHHLAWFGAVSTLGVMAVAMCTYPLAWWRRTRAMVEGVAKRERHSRAGRVVRHGLHATLVRHPAARAVWHFIGANLLRVSRYRMYLVMYGGVGGALVLASILRTQINGAHLRFLLSPQGLRVAIPVTVFWTVSGLHTTFLSTSDQQGRWVFRVISGQAGFQQLRAATRWVCLWSIGLSGMLVLIAYVAMPALFDSWRITATQLLVVSGLSLLLTDAFFLQDDTIPFTGSRRSSGTNFALLLIPYLGFFPAIVLLTVAAEPWIEASALHIPVAAILGLGAHLCMQAVRRHRAAENLQRIEADEDEEDFPLRLGLRY